MATKPRRFSARFGPDFGIGRYCVTTVDPDAATPEGTIGTVRLWSDGNPSGVYVYISLSDKGNASVADEGVIGQELLAHMTASQVDFSRFSVNHVFSCDVHVPAALVARYS